MSNCYITNIQIYRCHWTTNTNEARGDKNNKKEPTTFIYPRDWNPNSRVSAYACLKFNQTSPCALASRIKCFRGDKIRITLWGKFAYFLTEDVIGSKTVLIITSTMVQRFNGKSIKLTCYSYHLQILTDWLYRFVPKVNQCHKNIYRSGHTRSTRTSWKVWNTTN